MSQYEDNLLDYVAYLNSISSSIEYYSLWFIWPVCVVGNLFSLYIFTRPSLNKKTNTGVLYSWLCILDVIMMVYYVFVTRAPLLFGYTVLTYPCGLSNYLRRTALNVISWMQVVIGLDRFIVVMFPRKAKWFNRNRVLHMIMLMFLALVLITNVTNLLTYQVTTTTANNVTTTSCYTNPGVSAATSLIAVLMRVFLPFGAMLTLNMTVVWRLKHSKIKVAVATITRVAGNNGGQGRREFTNKEYKFMVATIIIDFVYLFFYLPLGVTYVIIIYNTFATSITGNPLANASFNLFSNVSQLLAIAHTDALVFVFVIFNRYFRDELIDLLGLRTFFPQRTDNTTNASRAF